MDKRNRYCGKCKKWVMASVCWIEAKVGSRERFTCPLCKRNWFN